MIPEQGPWWIRWLVDFLPIEVAILTDVQPFCTHTGTKQSDAHLRNGSVEAVQMPTSVWRSNIWIGVPCLHPHSLKNLALLTLPIWLWCESWEHDSKHDYQVLQAGDGKISGLLHIIYIHIWFSHISSIVRVVHCHVKLLDGSQDRTGFTKGSGPWPYSGPQAPNLKRPILPSSCYNKYLKWEKSGIGQGGCRML